VSTPRLRAVLFDLDGTLIDSHRLIVASFQHACLAVLDRPMTEADARIRWGRPLPVRFAAVAPDRIPDLVDAYAAYYDQHERALASVFPGVAEMLDALARAGLAMAVVTSKRNRAATQALRVLGLSQWIGATIGAEDVPSPKPAADPVREALRRLGASPESALVVGDSVLDMRAARAAGVRSAAALWGAEDPDAVLACGPDYVVRSPDEVTALAASA